MPPTTGIASLEALYRAQYHAFVRVASAIAGDPARGADAVHDAFACAIERLGSYRGETPLEAWVWRIVIRAADAARPRPVAPVEAAEGTESGAGEPGIRALVAALPERQPPAVFLRYFDYRAIADALTRATAPLALGPRAVWPGPAVGALRFGSVHLEQLWPIAPGPGGGAPALGLRLVYTGGGRTLEVQESAKLQPGGLTVPRLLPPAGTLRLACLGCGVANWPGVRIRWTGQLRNGPLFVGITATTPALVLAAARALAPMP